MQKHSILCGVLVLLVLAIPTLAYALPSTQARILFIPMTSSSWKYGLSMIPTVSQYDAVEMPAAGMHWTTAPSGTSILFWVSSTTTGGNFAQNGYVYNGLSAYLCIADGSTCIPPNSWGMFYTYTVSGVYHGNGVLPPSGWNAGHNIYFSIAVYPSKGEFSFQFDDKSRGQATIVGVCHAGISGRFQGNVGALSEDGNTGSFGNIYVDRLALWDEVLSTSQRNSGNTNAYAEQTPPSSDLIYIYTANVAQLGFNIGTHYASGTRLWNGNFYSGLEDVPPDVC